VFLLWLVVGGVLLVRRRWSEPHATGAPAA
jgi:hypothetical protein